ncbi:hypothetical protein EPO04_03220 [Patescibacteria group bacterium]|nr:MAG: hypothetical protein EPO04_03220 [Patescibacteria group bacterium]
MKPLNKKLLAVTVAVQVAVLSSPLAALAEDTPSPACKGASAAGAPCDKSGFEGALGNILNSVFFLVGALAVIALLIGAVRYVTSTGDQDRIKQAKNTIVYAVTGLIVALLARQIVGFVIGSLF